MDNVTNVYEMEKIPNFRFEHSIEFQDGIVETAYIFNNYAIIYDAESVGIYYNNRNKEFNQFVFGYNRESQTAFYSGFSMRWNGPVGNLSASNSSSSIDKRKQDYSEFVNHLQSKFYRVDPILIGTLSFLNVVEKSKPKSASSRYHNRDCYMLDWFTEPRYSSMVRYIADPKDYISTMDSHFESETREEYRRMKAARYKDVEA